MRPPVPAAAALAVVLGLAGTAPADAPIPGADDLGWSQNDVSDEPDHDLDRNGFPHTGFSPRRATLILDAYVETRAGSRLATTWVDEDVDAVRHNAMPGTSHEDGEQRLYPGQVTYEAWWGRWTDTGGGGAVQGHRSTGSLLDTTPNGAIDDAHDCRSATWDEFRWRGDNPCWGVSQPGDRMLGFVQPGTHDLHVNTLVVGCSCPDDAVLASDADGATRPDLRYEDALRGDEQVWRQASGFSRIEYDASLLVTTEVTAAVNPARVAEDASGPRYDPHAPGGAPHAVDVDVYSAAAPAVEALYRAAVWDPGDEQASPLDLVHPEGPKGLAKGPLHDAWLEAQETARHAPHAFVEPTERLVGAATNLVVGPYEHEPNTDADRYPASLDASYGAIDGYYDVHAQDYSEYQEKERFWIDVKVAVNTFPVWIPGCCFGYQGYAHVQPNPPSPDDPVAGAFEPADTQGPGVLYLHADAGTWHDANADTWVGAPDDEHPHDGEGSYYDGGTDPDPNRYGSDEFRGTCSAAFPRSELVPTDDVDGDGVGEWGAAGVYVLGDFSDGNPYSDAAMDVAGPEGNTATEPLRGHPLTSGAARDAAPEDEDGRLSRHRVEGPIDVRGGWFAAPENCGSMGAWDNTLAVLFPAGSGDLAFEAVHEVTLTDADRVSRHGRNAGTSLAGEAVTDVDRFEAVLHGTG